MPAPARVGRLESGGQGVGAGDLLEPNRQTYWFGAGVAPDGNEVWFRIDMAAVHRMQEKTPRTRGTCLIDILIAWMTPPDRQLGPELNRFQVGVSDDRNTWIERYGD